jgi:hypothetical protein
MLYMKTAKIHTKHMNTLCGQKVEFLTLNLVVNRTANNFKRLKQYSNYTRHCLLHYKHCNCITPYVNYPMTLIINTDCIDKQYRTGSVVIETAFDRR